MKEYKTIKYRLLILFVLIALLFGKSSYAQTGCCTNPGASPWVCRTEIDVEQDNCCPAGGYDTATYPNGPISQSDCISRFFEAGASETIGACTDLGCCCINVAGSQLSRAFCSGENSEFISYDGSEDFFSCGICVEINGCIDGIIAEGVSPLLNQHQDGVCQGSIQTCSYEGWIEYYEYIPDYEVNELSCDKLDNDCDGNIDEGCDTDSDGYCDSEMYVLDLSMCNFGGEDCDDLNGAINPDASEICDGIDNNCDETIDEGCAIEVEELAEEVAEKELAEEQEELGA